MSLSVLLLGYGGMLAQDIVARSPRDVLLETRTEDELDITTLAVEQEIKRLQPDVVINAAAYTAVDRAESERDLALAVNGEALSRIGDAAARVGSMVVHFGTDYVFNGASARPYREEDVTDPLGAYGVSKLEGEQRLAMSGVRHIIIRSQWLFGAHGNSFPRTMWQRAVRGQQTKVVNDQYGRPTYTVDLAEATWRLISESMRSTKRQVIHFANSGQTTWYGLAKHVFDAAAVPELLKPCSTAEYPTAARRPVRSVLDTTVYERLTDTTPRRWQDALDDFLNVLRLDSVGE